MMRKLRLGKKLLSEKLSSKRRRASYRPLVELLEDRCVMSASIFGNIWNDLIADAVRQATEPGVAGVVAFVDDGSGAFDGSQAHAISDGSGNYKINGLPAGTHTIALALP